MSLEQQQSNILSDTEFLAELGIGEKPAQAKPIPQKDVIDTLDEELKLKEQEATTTETQTENQEPEKSEADIKAEEDKKVKRFGVKDTVNALIENNQWSDVAVKYGDKQYESISELLANETPNKELFASLSKLQSDLRESKLKEDYVSIKGKDETKVKLINAILTGVDYEDLLEYNKKVVEPVQKLDFTKQDLKITKNFVKQCLMDLEGIPEKYLDIELAELEKNFTLIDKAVELQERVLKNYEEEIELRTKTEETLKAQKEEERNNEIKSFRKTLKDKDFSDTFTKQIIDLRFKKDVDGTSHHDKFLKDKLKDEEFASRYYHFLLDTDDFLNKEKSKVKAETQTKFMEMVHIIPKDNGSKQSKERSVSLSEADENFLTELNK